MHLRRFVACYSSIALLVMFLYAPFFHVHSAGEHNGGAPLIHTHFPAMKHQQKGHSLDGDDHHKARSVDIYTATQGLVLQTNAVITDADVPLVEPPRICLGFVQLGVPRSHAPPPQQGRIPRAPPL